MKETFVYLAGKIHKNGWRDKILDYSVTICGEKDIIATKASEYLFSCGPFFISCDHGCYHGENSHGVGAYKIGEEFPDRCQGKGTPQALVPTVCMNQINKSDFVFAYIDSASCYGTLCEIGYAIGKGKPVAVMFATDKLKNDMWFIAEIANIVFNRKSDVLKCETNEPDMFDFAQNLAYLIDMGCVPWA